MVDGQEIGKFMTETKNICEDTSSYYFAYYMINEEVHTVNSMQNNVIYLLSFFTGVSLFINNRLKKIFSKKTTKIVTDKDLLNFPQAADKAKSQAEINALLACFN